MFEADHQKSADHLPLGNCGGLPMHRGVDENWCMRCY